MSSSEMCPSCGPSCGGHALLTAGEREAWLGLQGWKGLDWQRVVVVAETPRRYRIRAITANTKLPRHRYIHPDGNTALVPKGAIRFGQRPEGR